MRLITYAFQGRAGVGAVRGSHVIPLDDVAPDMLGLIALGSAGLARAAGLFAQAADGPALDAVQLLAPIPRPPHNVMCLGRNYAEHARESQTAWGQDHGLPEYPVIFTKSAGSIAAPDGQFRIDPRVSSQIDWEAELAVIVSMGGRDIPVERAMDYVYGYTCLNDLSARDIQQRHQQYFKGKSLDGSCPLGPWIVTRDDVPDPHALRILCRVNGELKQDGHTSHMIFRLPEIIAALSLGMTLEPGDIIATGTPSGVGFARQPPEFLEPGDVVEVEVESIGTLRTHIVAG